MTFQRATAFRLVERSCAACGRARDRGRAATIRASRPRPGRARRPASTSSCAARASRRSRELLRALEARRPARRGSPGLSFRANGGFRHNPPRPIRPLEDDSLRLPNRAARVLERLHAARPAGRRRRDLARLHLRLQLLLDHRDARPQLPPPRFERVLADIARRARARRARDLPRRRQHHARRAAVRGAVRRDHRGGARRRRLHRAGDDVADRRPRRDARAADAAGRLPLRVPRDRERPGRGPRLPEGATPRTRATRTAARPATRRSRRSSTCTATACSSSAG